MIFLKTPLNILHTAPSRKVLEAYKERILIEPLPAITITQNTADQLIHLIHSTIIWLITNTIKAKS